MGGKWQPAAKEGAGRAAVVEWVKALRKALAVFNVGDTAHTLDGNMEAQLSGVAAVFGPNYERVKGEGQVRPSQRLPMQPQHYARCVRARMAHRHDSTVWPMHGHGRSSGTWDNLISCTGDRLEESVVRGVSVSK